MACYYPVQAYRTELGEIKFVERGAAFSGTLSFCCGRCIGCRLDRADEWATRVMHEASMWPRNCFVTLTYDEAHAPSDRSIQYSHLQKFFKRLRKQESFRDYFFNLWHLPIRYFACGEYGDKFDRPHFHVALFNVDFATDRVAWRRSSSGFMVDRSATLERLWTFGNSEIGELTRESAGYIARYSLKKITGDKADEHYKAVDRETGEVTWREPECVHMSLKPGIGYRWFQKFNSDVFPHDRVVVRGVERGVPRYYDDLMKRRDPRLLEDLQQGRLMRAKLKWADSTPERLAVREKVAAARLKFFKRSLK